MNKSLRVGVLHDFVLVLKFYGGFSTDLCALMSIDEVMGRVVCFHGLLEVVFNVSRL